MLSKKPLFKKSEMHGDLPNLGTVVSASAERRGGALYKYPNKLGGEKEKK